MNCQMILLLKFLLLMTFAIKDGDKFYPQLYLEEALFLKWTLDEKIVRRNIGFWKRIEWY